MPEKKKRCKSVQTAVFSDRVICLISDTYEGIKKVILIWTVYSDIKQAHGYNVCTEIASSKQQTNPRQSSLISLQNQILSLNTARRWEKIIIIKKNTNHSLIIQICSYKNIHLSNNLSLSLSLCFTSQMSRQPNKESEAAGFQSRSSHHCTTMQQNADKTSCRERPSYSHYLKSKQDKSFFPCFTSKLPALSTSLWVFFFLSFFLNLKPSQIVQYTPKPVSVWH